MQPRLKSGSLVETDFLYGEKREAGFIANAQLPVHRVHRTVYNEYEKYEQNLNPKLEERLLWEVIAGAKDDMRLLVSGSTAIRQNL